MQQPKYDTVEGITEYLKDISGLNKLKYDRSEAYYSRKETLNEFIILGRWWADRCGNFGKLSNYSGAIVPAMAIYRCPPVLTNKEMFDMIGEGSSISSSMDSNIPPDYAKCFICEQTWSIKDVHDCVSSNKTEVIDATPFVGATLSNITRLPQYIDVAPHYITHDCVRPKNLTQGSERVKKNYIIQPGDNIFVNVWSYSHIECNKLRYIQYSIKDVTEAINNTGLLCEFELIAIKNRYNSERNDPWFRLKFKTSTGSHEIIMGWRSSVINIDWSKSNKSLLHLFHSEMVTKDDSLIHAYGYKKATEYLTKIIPAL